MSADHVAADVQRAALIGALAVVVRHHRPPQGLPIACSCGATVSGRGGTPNHPEHLATMQVDVLTALGLLPATTAPLAQTRIDCGCIGPSHRIDCPHAVRAL